MSFLPTHPAYPTPDGEGIAWFSAPHEPEMMPRMRPHDVRQTGIRLKLRFLLTLVSLAVFLAVGLVVLLGDPSGTEQQASLSQAAFLQAQTQAQALNQALAERQQQVTFLAHVWSQTPAASLLQAARHGDTSVLACLVANQNGLILAADQASRIGSPLTQDPDIPVPQPLLPLLQHTLQQPGTEPSLLIGGNGSGHNQHTWLAWAAPISPDRALMLVSSLPRLLQTFLAPTTTLPNALGVVLDAQGHVVALGGPPPTSALPLLSLAPTALQNLAPRAGSPSLLAPDPLTGQTDLAVSAALPALHGQYVLLIAAQTVWFPSMREVIAGHNTPLLLLGIVVFVILIATWFALPIIRPIRRTTRVLEQTTAEVRTLSIHAQTIASQHTLGVNLLIGASQHLTRRRDAIVRDLRVLQQTVNALAPHVRIIQQAARLAPQTPLNDAAGALTFALTQIGSTSRGLEQGLTNDRGLNSLAEAMEGAQEISQQFEAAGVQLVQETHHLETASARLL